MPEYKTDTYSKIEALIGLKLFDATQLTGEEKEKYRRYVKTDGKPRGDAEKLLGWYFKFMPGFVKEMSRKITRYVRLSSLLLMVLSFITGVSAAGILFYYDGSTPINVLPILAIFVLLPLIFLLISLIFPYFFKTDSGFISPVFHWIEDRIEVQIARFNITNKQTLNENISEYELVYNDPVQTLFRKTLQKSAAAYVTGALLWMIFNVTTTDLAFSWSSTIELEGETIYSITNVMSSPWGWLLPSATVDFETVQSTRFFRADQSDIMSTSSGGWWSFIFMSIAVYSLLPRIFLLFYFKWRFTSHINASLVDSETGHAILTLNDESLWIETANERNHGEYPDPDRGNISDNTDRVIVLLWYLSDFDETLISKRLNRNVISVHKISGLSSTNKDKAIAGKIAGESADYNSADIIVFVKFWESPNIRLEKILKEIAEISTTSTIKIIPLVEEHSQYNSANEKNWGSRIASINRDIGRKRIFIDSESLTNMKSFV